MKVYFVVNGKVQKTLTARTEAELEGLLRIGWVKDK
jgi:hypothetical protein